MKRLDSKVAVVTGAGSGIGRAIALRFGQEGAKVVVTDIRIDKATEAAAEIVRDGGVAMALRCDVSSRAECEQAIAQARLAYGAIDILVNNAVGAIVGGPMQTFCECSNEFMDALLGVNLLGAIYMTRGVVEEMKHRKSGRIINFSSVRGMVGDSANILYGTAKGAIISFTKSLAMEMGRYGVTVNSIAPGAIASREGPARMKTYLGHPGTCDDVAALAAFLASKEAAFITGDNIPIDGGRSNACYGDQAWY